MITILLLLAISHNHIGLMKQLHNMLEVAKT